MKEMVKCFIESGPSLRKREVKVYEHLASMRNPEYLKKKKKKVSHQALS